MPACENIADSSSRTLYENARRSRSNRSSSPSSSSSSRRANVNRLPRASNVRGPLNDTISRLERRYETERQHIPDGLRHNLNAGVQHERELFRLKQQLRALRSVRDRLLAENAARRRVQDSCNPRRKVADAQRAQERLRERQRANGAGDSRRYTIFEIVIYVFAIWTAVTAAKIVEKHLQKQF